MNCICLACLLGEILNLPMCLIGYSSVSLILYREGRRTIGHIQFADACDFRGSLRRDWQLQRHWTLSTNKKQCSYLIRWLSNQEEGATAGFPSKCWGCGEDLYSCWYRGVLLQLTVWLLPFEDTLKWSYTSKQIIAYNTLDYHSPLKTQLQHEWTLKIHLMILPAWDLHWSSSEREKVERYCQGPGGAGTDSHYFTGIEFLFLKDEKCRGDGADESCRAKQMFFRVASCTFQMRLLILCKPYLS